MRIKTFTLSNNGHKLAQKAVRGGMWVLALQFFDRLFSFIRTVVLARILSPNDFGIMGIALVSMFALEGFSQTGVEAALIQRKEVTRSFLDTAWVLQAVRGVVLCMLLLVAAPSIAAFFKVPEAMAIVRIVAIAQLFKGFTNIYVVYFQKELQFHKQFIYRISGTITDFVVAVSAALILRSAWALVIGLLAAHLVRFIVSYAMCPWRPNLNLQGEQLKQLIMYGKWLFAARFIACLALHGDDIVVGRILGPFSLGLYQIAFFFSNITATEIAHVVSQVTFPAYSKLQDNISKLREGFLATVEFVALISVPITVMILLLGSDFTHIFLGEKWLYIIPALQIIALGGFIRSIAVNGGSLFKAVGKVNLSFWISFIRVLVLAVTIYPLTKKFSIAGTAMSVTLAVIIIIPVHFFFWKKIMDLQYWQLLKRIFYPLIGGLIMSGIIISSRIVMPDTNIYNFVSLAMLGMAGYLVYILLWNRLSNREAFKSFEYIFKILRPKLNKGG